MRPETWVQIDAYQRLTPVSTKALVVNGDHRYSQQLVNGRWVVRHWVKVR
jgi:hypothetical protein